MEKVKIQSGKNKLSAVISRPDEKTERLAILCPGFIDSKDYDHLVYLASELAGKGFTVVRFDPTGTWESEGLIGDYTDTQYLEDIRNVLKYMLEDCDYKYILLGGHSHGGLMSLLYAATDSRVSEVLAIMAPSPDTLVKQKRIKWETEGFRFTSRDIPGTTEIKEFRVPYSHLQDRDKYNVLDEVKKIHVPIIFVAGELDSVVLPEHVKQIYDAANEPKKFILMKGISHDYRKSLDKINIVNKKILEELSYV